MSAPAELIACVTCGARERDEQGRTRGEQMLAALEAAQVERGLPDVTISGTRCLWACTRSCAVHVRSPGRVGYVLGDLAPSDNEANALLDYAKMYADSAEGTVPFRQWPAPVRGHFICRIPPAPVVVAPAQPITTHVPEAEETP